MMTTCVLCGRPAHRQPGQLTYCQQDKRRLDRVMEEKRQRRAKADWRTGLFRVVHWKGYLVGFYPAGPRDGPGPHPVKPQPLAVDMKRVQKSILIDLDTFQEGFSREQVKAMKRAVAQVYGL